PVRGERQPERVQQGARLRVVHSGRRDRDVEAANLVDAVVVDLGEDDLLANAERVVATPVERVGAQAAEVADARKRDRYQAVEELPHAVAPQGDLHADGHPLADLELRDRLASAAYLRALAGDGRQLVECSVDLLRIGLALTDAHVERDLRDRRRLHDRAQLELVLEARADLRVVALLQARHVRPSLRNRSHYLSISWPQPSRLQTRTLTCSPPFASLKR